MRAHQNRFHSSCLVALTLSLSTLAGCKLDDKGLAGASAESPAPPSSPPGPSVGRADGGGSVATPTPGLDAGSATASDATAPPTGVGPAEAGSGGADLSPPSTVPPTTDAGLAPEATPPAASVCASLSNGRFIGRMVEDLPRSDEITFDNEGRLLAFSQNSVIRIAMGAPMQFVARNVIGQGGGALRVLADGDIVVADYSRDRLIRIDASSGLERAPMSVRSPMKLVRGPGDMVFVTSNDGIIYRIDPQKVGLPGNNQGQGNSESRSVVAETNLSLGGLSFSADYRKLYVGSIDRDEIIAFPVDDKGTLGRQTVFASQIPKPQSLATDLCGNVYAVGNQDGRVRRLSTDGKVTVIAELPARDIWAVSFGSGRHGFAADALYALDRNGGALYEIKVGVTETPTPTKVP